MSLIPPVAATFDYTDDFWGAKNLLLCYFSPQQCVRKKYAEYAETVTRFIILQINKISKEIVIDYDT